MTCPGGPISGLPTKQLRSLATFAVSLSGIAFVPLGRRLKHSLAPTFIRLLEYTSAHLQLTGHAETLCAGRLIGKVAQDNARFSVKPVALWGKGPPASRSHDRKLVTPSGIAEEPRDETALDESNNLFLSLEWQFPICSVLLEANASHFGRAKNGADLSRAFLLDILTKS